MQSERCIWYMEKVGNFVLSQEDQTSETERRGTERVKEELSILLCFIILQDTSVVDNTVSSSRLRTASVTMVS